MSNINIFSAACLNPEQCRNITAVALGVEVENIFLFDTDCNVKYGIEDASIRATYERLRGDFTFELGIWSDRTKLSIRQNDFAESFSRLTGSICTVDTPDGNPFTWILFKPGAAARVAEIDDDFRVVDGNSNGAS